MEQVGRKVAVGALWMISLRLIERSVGFVSTLILARLLLPADFGLIAMAMTVFAFVEIAGQFGFDVALIRNREARRAHYDSAWTLQLGYAVFSAVVLALLAIPTAAFFNEPRLTAIVFALAAVALVQGLENIGIVDFRKNFEFGRDFRLMFTKKIIAFVVTVSLAVAFRSYWALLGGIAVSRVAGVVLSFWLHPFRPRLDVSEVRGLLNFSRWIVLGRVLGYFNERGPDFLVGRFLDAGALGLFSVSREVATLPTTELSFPIMRAVFPGYAAVAGDRSELASSFLTVQGVIVMLAVPAAAGIAMLADPIVRLLLGPNWLAAIPLVQILGLYGALTTFQATNASIFHVLGVPYYAAMMKAIEVGILLPAMLAVLWLGFGLLAAAWSVFAAQAVVIPVGMMLIGRLLGVTALDRVRVVWRPLTGTAMMVAAIYGVLQFTGRAGDAAQAAMQLSIVLPVAALTWAGAILGLWQFAGRPDGPERRLIELIRAKLGHAPQGGALGSSSASPDP
jgi:lipopolysaccharide exporter